MLYYIFNRFPCASSCNNNMRKGIHSNMHKGKFSKGRDMSYIHLPESIRPKALGIYS